MNEKSKQVMKERLLKSNIHLIEPDETERLDEFRYRVCIDDACSGKIFELSGWDYAAYDSFFLRLSPYGRLPGQLSKREWVDKLTEESLVELLTGGVVVESLKGIWGIRSRVRLGPGIEHVRLRLRCHPAHPGGRYYVQISVSAACGVR